MKTYLGSPTAARNYLEADRGRADDYYLAEGAGIAQRYSVDGDGPVIPLSPLTGEAYEAWVAGVDPDTGAAKGRLRHDDQAVRFVEVTVNGPKSWSLAAELHPDIAAAYDAAQDRAAEEIIGWLGAHATTRVGPRGGQVQIPVTAIEAVTVRHHTSRAGDPHRHLHLQINARVFAAGEWRGLHTVGVRDCLDAVNGIGHAAVATDPQFRAALAVHGFTLDPDGEIEQLAPYVGAFSARAAQIAANIDRYETDWQTTHPGQSAGPGLRRSWDARAWADGRPDKVTPAPGAELNSRWLAELAALGYRDQDRLLTLHPQSVGSLDREGSVTGVLARLSARRSRWNAADVRGEVEQLLARAGIVTDPTVRVELAEDLTARAITRCAPLLERDGVPQHVRALTSEHALDVEADLGARLAARGTPVAIEPAALIDTARGDVARGLAPGLDSGQLVAAGLLAGRHGLVVIEGAAGAGKTTTLAAARDLLATQDRRLMVVTPTVKAAKVAAAELRSHAGSAAGLAFAHGYRWDEHGVWTRLQPGQTDPRTGGTYRGPDAAATLRPGDLLLVDEAGMLDQDTARALLTIADEHHARLALVGDRHQLAAVGRGGVLDLAVRHVDPTAHVTLDHIHRFTHTTTTADGTPEVALDVEYAQLSLAMRSGDNPAAVFDALAVRGQIRVHRTDDDRVAALAELAAAAALAGDRTVVVADTRDQVAQLNAATRDRLVAAGHVDDQHAVTTAAGSRIGVGDRVTTRRNDAGLDVANRDTWTVTHLDRAGQLTLTSADSDGDGHGDRVVPPSYVKQHLELAYATTVHGVQGDTAGAAHLAVGAHTGAASAYVGMTRGRTANTAHLVAADFDDARDQWVAAFGRDRADLGPAHAATLAAAEVANYAQPRPLADVLVELRAAWTAEQHALNRIAFLQPQVTLMREVAAARHEHDTTMAALTRAQHDTREAAARAAARLQTSDAVVARDANHFRDALFRQWDEQRPAASAAARTVTAGTGLFGIRRAAVADARAALQDWAATWRPYLPDMPTDPDALTRVAGRPDNRTDLRNGFDSWARQRCEQLHPEHGQARTAAHQTQAVAQRADTAHRDARQGSATLLWRYGNAGHTPDPAGRAAELDHQLADAHDQLELVRTSITALTGDPALLSRPAHRLTNERSRWEHDQIIADLAQAARHQLADETSQTNATLDHLHHQSTPHHVEHGPGFGR